jgi:radical SAM superfamily enzyme YgiQ (UPF0313 family)
LTVLLISTYELGRQPFGLASPAAWLRNAGFQVECVDLSRTPLNEAVVRRAEFIGFYLPMHTATRLAVQMLPRIRQINRHAHLCFYGLYAPMNEPYLRKLGAEVVLGGEFEEDLVQAVKSVVGMRGDHDGGNLLTGLLGSPADTARLPTQNAFRSTASPARLKFLVPYRRGLPDASHYARLEFPGDKPRITGYTEASRGCKHLCRHCPVVPVYQGRFRIVQPEVVLEDIRTQVAAGAQHITFGDPDFFNGIRHAVSIITTIHREHPRLTYDVTIKVEHLLKYAHLVQTLRDTGCLFVTTAVESFDDHVLARLDKGHTYADSIRVLEMFRRVGLALAPTFVAFTPWTTPQGYCDFLDAIARLDLVENVAPVQLGVRLLVPAGSRLLELEEIAEIAGSFDEAALMYPWRHRDGRVDELHERVQSVIAGALRETASRTEIFRRIWRIAQTVAAGNRSLGWHDMPPLLARAAIPYLTEPWYC